MNSKRKDLTGGKFNRLTVLSFSHVNKHRFCMWLCVCECGEYSVVAGNALRNGKIKSCGCIKHELDLVRRKTHGFTSNSKVRPEYNSWYCAKDRCLNKNNPQYKDYGGRGIKMCDRWLNSFENFYLDMGDKPSDKHTLDRYPDNNGDYSPLNCRWATPKQQNSNTRKNVFLEHNGNKMILSDWARFFNVKSNTLCKHLSKGRDINWLINFYS